MLSKKVILISVVVILAVTAWYFTDKKNGVISSHDFVITDTSVINKIIFEKNSQRLKLEKLNSVWLVNDTFQVNNALVNRFLRVFGNLNLVAPISNNAKDTVVNNLKAKGTKISIYNNNRLQKEYLLGGLSSSKSGNIILLDEEKLAIINSSGLVKNLNDIVSVNSLFWRNRMIFNKTSGKIIRVTHKNILHNEKSYTINVKNGQFELLNSEGKPVNNFNPKAVERYLSYFQNIGFKQIESSLTSAQKDSILKFNHAHTIVLLDKSNIEYKLNLYFKPAGNGEHNEFDLNQIYGIMNNEHHILIFEYYVIDPILKGIDYFVQKII